MRLLSVIHDLKSARVTSPSRVCFDRIGNLNADMHSDIHCSKLEQRLEDGVG